MRTNLNSRHESNLLYFGIVSTIFGLVALLWPGLTAVTFVIIWGVFALCDGVAALVLAVKDKEHRALLIIKGILGVIVGLSVILIPGTGITAAAWTLGFWLILRGTLDALEAWAMPTTKQKILGFLRTLLWVLAAAVIMANPASAAVGFSIWLGAFVLATGISSIALYATARRARKAYGSSATTMS